MLKILRQLGSHRTLLQTIKTMEEENRELNRRHDAIEKVCLEQKVYIREAFHELRNSIHIITGNSELLTNETEGCQLSLQSVRLADHIREASHNILHFLDAGLALAKPDAGAQRRWEPLHIRQWLQKMTSLYHHQAHMRQLKIQCEVAESFPACIQMDMLLLRQIVGNLLHNAIRFSLPGTGIRIDCYEGEAEWTMVCANKSAAVDSEKLKDVFQPFHTMGHPESNTGLGLSIARRYVELLGGSIQASCIKDKFIVWLRLPLRIVSGAEAPPLVIERPRPKLVIHNTRKVLVIEDNPLSQRLTCNFLKEMGLRHIITACRAEEGLLLARQFRPELVLMDLHLPDQEGIKTLQSLKAMLKNTPVIVMSGTCDPADNAPLLQAGASEYLLKPFSLQQVARIVQQYLDMAQLDL
jgi:CheY-like chemotaxis protein/two-component sensor histidine kinase